MNRYQKDNKPQDWVAEDFAKLLATMTPEVIAREERWFRRHALRSRARARKARRGWR